MPAAGESAFYFLPANTAHQLLVFLLVLAASENENEFKFKLLKH
jgi:hypothetical protein